MSDVIYKVFDKLDEAEAALGEAHRLIVSTGVDVAEDTDLLRLRRLREDIGDVRDRIEANGLEA